VGVVKQDSGYVWSDTPDRIYDGCTASATITTGQVLEVTGSGTLGPAGAASTATVGMAVGNAASGAPVRLYTANGVWSSTASGGITAGARLVAGAAGTVATIGANTFQTMIGTALTTALNGAQVLWVPV
jgi:hypothetical protein